MDMVLGHGVGSWLLLGGGSLCELESGRSNLMSIERDRPEQTRPERTTRRIDSRLGWVEEDGG